MKIKLLSIKIFNFLKNFIIIFESQLFCSNLNYLYDVPIKLIALFCQIILQPNHLVYSELYETSKMELSQVFYPLKTLYSFVDLIVKAKNHLSILAVEVDKIDHKIYYFIYLFNFSFFYHFFFFGWGGGMFWAPMPIKQ